MDRIKLDDKIKSWFGRYRYILLVIAFGILLMQIPVSAKPESWTEASSVPKVEERSLSEELADILSQISGVGRVRVMLTEAAGAETVYQTDEDRSVSAESSTIRLETVIISSGNSDAGLIKTVTPPTYLGAIIVCQGGDNPSVRLSVAQAVSAVTGIGMDRITVLKMK